VVLERVEVARLGSQGQRELRHLAGRPRMVRRELASLLRLPEAAAARCENDGRGLDLVLPAQGEPAVLDLA
jgi:hypothetical protein